jgi:DNA mismatch repair ATPase MutL
MTRLLDQLRGDEPQLQDVMKALSGAIAVRSGQVMTTDEMRSLIAGLERCPDPLLSPSGRKVLLHLSSEQLADQFSNR